MRSARNGFDLIAKPYRWMEYITFGRGLERCRFRFLPDLKTARQVLVLGDGDGRFTVRLLLAVPQARVHAVDGSAAMLGELRRRCQAAGVAGRLEALHADLTTPLPDMRREQFDAVATHFFLDCLTSSQIDSLVSQVKPLLAPDAVWIVSEFAVPDNGAMRLPSAFIVRSLYFGFRILTGLRTQRLPDYPVVFRKHGFVREERIPSCKGLLAAELWRLV